MAIFLTHGLFASIFSFLWKDKKTKFAVFLLIFIASILPDIDFIFDGKGSGMFTHRGITHSLFFAGMTGVVFSALFLSVVKSTWQSLLLMIIFFLASASHCLLDAMTEATYGICIFCPFSDERFFLPVTPFAAYTASASHAKKGFRPGLGNSVWITLLPEILWVWVPAFTIYAINYYLSEKPAEVKSGKPVSNYKPIQIKQRETPKPTAKKYPNQKKR